MVQKEFHSERMEKSSPLNLIPAEFAALGRKRIEDFVHAQTELVDELQKANRQWFDCLEAETKLASEFAAKLTAARSIPDAMLICQDWTSRRFELMAQQGQHLLSDSQRLMQTSARLLANGWQPNGSGTSS